MNTLLSYKSRYNKYTNLKTKSSESLSFKYILDELQEQKRSLLWEYYNPYSNNLLYDSSYDYEHRKEYCYYNRYNINFMNLYSGIPNMQKIRSYTFKFHKKLVIRLLKMIKEEGY